MQLKIKVMGCINCNEKIRKDFDYIRKLAFAYGMSEKKDVQIYAFYIGLTKLYDFDELPTREKRSEIVEIIQFSEPKSIDVLQDTGEPESKTIDQEGPGEKITSKRSRKHIPKMDKDSRTILPIDG